jgi:hypothetical protein
MDTTKEAGRFIKNSPFLSGSGFVRYGIEPPAWAGSQTLQARWRR